MRAPPPYTRPEPDLGVRVLYPGAPRWRKLGRLREISLSRAPLVTYGRPAYMGEYPGDSALDIIDPSIIPDAMVSNGEW